MTPPRLAARYDVLDYLEEAARHLLIERVTRYPAAIATGKIDPDVAQRKLDFARALAAQWRWAIEPFATRAPLPDWTPPGPFGAEARQLAAEVADAATRAAAQAGRAPADDRLRAIADCYAALAWWQEPSSPYRSRIVEWAEWHRAINVAAQHQIVSRRAAA